MPLDEPPQYTKSQITMLETIFKTFDVEETGHIPIKVIPMTLQTLGVKIKDEEMDKLVEEIDKDKSGKVEFGEYIDLAKRYIVPEEDYNKLYNELREAFMIFDKQNKGYMEIEEFKKLIKELDPALPAEEINEIVDEVDADGSGRIEFEEFMEVMMGDD